MNLRTTNIIFLLAVIFISLIIFQLFQITETINLENMENISQSTTGIDANATQLTDITKLLEATVNKTYKNGDGSGVSIYA
jgi:hypothetical protein